MTNTKLNHSWFQKNRTKTHSVISNVRTRTQKTPSNADANFESTRFFFKKKISQDYQMIFVIFRIDFVYHFKLDFSQTLSLRTMVCLKAKSLSKMRQYNQLEKSSRKFWFANKITLNKNPTITCRVLTISPDIMSTSYCSRLHNVKTKRDKRTAKKA